MIIRTNRRRSALPVPAVLLALALVWSGCAKTSDKGTGLQSLTFLDDIMPLGLVGTTYVEAVAVAGGTEPYTFSVKNADLPPGLAPQKEGTSFTLAGTPTTEGTFAFLVTVTDADGAKASADITLTVAAAVDPAGGWSYDTLVTEANGSCTGEAGDRTVHQVTITRVGNQVTLDGLLGIPGNQVSGTRSGNRLTLTGTYPEDGGHTTGIHNLVFYTPNLLKGIEDWDWTNGGPNDPGVCPSSVSRIVATRVP